MRKRKAFTLIELLVVVAIIALLVAILVPVVTKAKEQANRSVCGVNLHQIILGLRMYYDDFEAIPGCWPQGITQVGETVPDFPYGQHIVHSGNTVAFGNGFETGLGVLYHGDYAAAAELYWCPSTVFPWHGKSREEQITNLVNAKLGTSNPSTSVVGSSQSSYYYRILSGYRYLGNVDTNYTATDKDITSDFWSGTSDGMYGHMNHVIRMEDWSSGLSAVVDAHLYPKAESDPDRSIHKDGFNAAYWDGRVAWVDDPKGEHSWQHCGAGDEVDDFTEPEAQTKFWLADYPGKAESYPATLLP